MTQSIQAGAARHEELRRMLEERRQELQAAIGGQMRSARDERDAREGDLIEVMERDFEEDMDFTLMTMKVETLARVEEALQRLYAGEYGVCEACGEDIARARLKALPFAVRCRDCEEQRESETRRPTAGTRRVGSLFSDLSLS